MTWSKIEWTDASWNPVTGCTKVSSGCLNCYAERMAFRLKAMGNPNYRNAFAPTIHEHMLDRPLTWKDPRFIFVNSMSDLFHEAVPESFIHRVFHVMALAKQHTFQVLTKRADRLVELAPRLTWPKHIWMGVSVEGADVVQRIDGLRNTPAAVKFLSCEPLIAPLGALNLSGIDWVIVGGESGPGARPMLEKWATDVRDTCISANIPFFFKQWGGVNKKAKGRMLWETLGPIAKT
jgi:protein gp37